jgi:hypothetical protein
MMPLVRRGARATVVAAVLVAVALGAVVARAQGVRIENLGSGSALTGAELIPMYQNADPAVTTTPAAIATYVNSTLKLTVNSGHTEISGLALSGSPTGSGQFMYGDTAGLLQASLLFYNDLTNALIYNYTALGFSALPSMPGGGVGFSVYGTNPGVSLVGIGNHNGWGILSFGGCYNGGSGWACSGGNTTAPDALGQTIYSGYNTAAWVIGALEQIIPTQNWTTGANGVQWQWCTVANGATYGAGCYIMTLDGTNGLVLTGVPVTASAGKFQGGGVTISGTAPTVGSGNISLGGQTAALSDCGSLSSSVGCLIVNIAGTTRYIPYY